MADMMSVKEAAMLWNIPETLVTRYCRAGRINGAVKNGRAWIIPADAQMLKSHQSDPHIPSKTVSCKLVLIPKTGDCFSWIR